MDGRLLSVQARYLGKEKDKPRFQFPKGSRCSIYNLPVLKLLRPGEPLFVTEGCSDCWSMLSAGHKAIAIPSATLLQESDFKLLGTWILKLGTSLHIFPDNDKAGEGLYNRLLDASIHIGFTLVRHQLPATCKDFSDFYLQSLRPES
jgi:DNA primase